MKITYFAKYWPKRGISGHQEKSINTIETLLNIGYELTVCSSDKKVQNKEVIHAYPLKVVDIDEKRILNNLVNSKMKPDIAIFDSPETESQYSAYVYNKWNKCSRIVEIRELKRL